MGPSRGTKRYIFDADFYRIVKHKILHKICTASFPGIGPLDLSDAQTVISHQIDLKS